MAETNETLFVARESDVEALKAHLDAARKGAGCTVVLSAPLGGGKRAVVGEVARQAVGASDDTLVWRTPLVDEEDGLRTLLRMYAGLYSVLHRTPLLKTKVEMVLNAQMPQYGQRVQGWLNAFIDGLKKGPKPGEETFQVSLPRDNPLSGLVEVVRAISSKITILMELQNVHHCHSVALYAFIEALMELTRDRSRLLLVLSTEPVGPETTAYMPPPWEDFLTRRKADYHAMDLAPWGETEVKTYLDSKSLSGNVGRIVEISGGKPGFVAELVDHLEALGRLGDSLEGETLASLTPTGIDEDELDDDSGETPAPDDEMGKRRKAKATDAPLVHHVGALLGHAFPSNLIADMAGLDRDSTDDLLDASSELLEELQFSEPIQSWLYGFKRGIFRFGILEANRTDEGRQRAVRVGTFMERFLAPRGFEFLVKTLRVYAEAGETRRCQILKSLALTSDVPDVWLMVHDFVQYFGDISWPAPMRRTVFLNFLDRLVNAGTVEAAEKVYNEAMQWATDNEDRPMQAQVLFSGSRLDYRRQDVFRARDRARDALTLFKAMDNKLKAAEVLNHISLVELSDGNANAALDLAKEAEELAPIPPIQANTEFVRGLIAKRDRKLPEAIDNFRKANELAGNAGMGPLALEAAINLGETHLMAQEPDKAADVLNKCIRISQALRNPVRERAAASLLAQAQALLQHWQAAMTSAQHTLDLTRKLKLERFVAADTYNVGFFALQSGKDNEAVSLFRQALQTANPQDLVLQREIQFHLGTTLKKIGETQQARVALQACLDPAQKTKEPRRLVEAQSELSDILKAQGDKQGAAALLKAAIATAEANDMREARKGLRRKLDTL